MPAGSTYTPIATTTLGSATSSYTFSSIAQTYTDLILIATLKSASASNALLLRVGNGSIDTGANYSYTNLIGNGSTATSGRQSASTSIVLSQGNQFMPTNLQNVYTMHFQNYSNTTSYKTALIRSSVIESASGFASSTVGLWRSTSAINQIQVSNVDNLQIGCTLTLYGIAAA